MNQEERYEAMSDYFVEHVPQLGEHVVDLPNRELELSDLDDIFAGRPLAEQPRAKANIPLKTYVTSDLNVMVESKLSVNISGKRRLCVKRSLPILRILRWHSSVP